MAQPIIQQSFSSGEWAPALNARVDLKQYKQAAALLRNFFVDYRGGASTRPGTKYILQAFLSTAPVRLITFAATSTVQYILEFGDRYIRFYNQGAAILESSFAITGATNANPCVLTVTGLNYNLSIGQWIFVTGVVGMTQLNGRYFEILAVTANTVSIGRILNGSNVDSTGYSPYISGGIGARVYTIGSPFAAADLALVKFVQNVNTMILTHPNYPPQVLTLVSANNWNITAATFGSTILTPTGPTIITTNPGTGNVSYQITSVDTNGQESGPTPPQRTTINTSGATVTVSWASMPGAVSYNVYRSSVSLAGVQPIGADFGFIANVSGTSIADTFLSGFNPAIVNNFAIGPPVVQNPFTGAPVASITLTAGGAYTTVPTVTIAPPPSGPGATAIASLAATSASVGGSVGGYSIGDTLLPIFSVYGANAFGGLSFRVTGVGGGGVVTSIVIVNAGSITGAGNSTPANPVSCNRNGVPGSGLVSINVNWIVGSLVLVQGGAGYTSVPAVTFSPPGAAAIATLGAASLGNPAVPGFYQQRLFLGGATGGPQSFNMSQPGSPYNFNISQPLSASDAISASIVAGQLNSIKSVVPVPTGLIIFSDRAAWLLNGGSGGAVLTPIDVTSNAHAYNGASDVPPIIINADIVYVQAKGSIVRYLTFNYYTQIFTGTDISVLSSHLFFGFTIKEWAWAEEPFKMLWSIRNDGALISLGLVKEQETIGWSHHDTQGTFQSITTCVETVTLPNATVATVDAVYVVAQRVVEGVTVQYVERIAERYFNNQVKNAWCVDSALQFSGAPSTVFRGLDNLAGATVTGLADGAVIPPTTVSIDGVVTLGTAASLVTLGLSFTPQLQTLRLDMGEQQTVQGKRKKITAVTVRVAETLGLSIGKNFSSLVPMKDLVVGNLGTMSNTVVTDLVTDDARTIIDPSWTVDGQYCIQQSNPFPATVLGVIPEIEGGDVAR